MPSVLTVLRRRDFALAWVGGLISMIGSWALWIALPIHVYELTGSARATSGVVAAVVAPGILFGSVAGVYVDRWDRKRTLVVTNVLLALSILPLLLATDADRLWLVYPTVVLFSTIGQFTDSAENAFLPRLVPVDQLVAANSLNALNNSLARLTGPVVGGALAATVGLGGVVLVDAATYLVAAALLALVRASGAVEAAGDAAADALRSWRRMAAEWRAGLAVVRGSRPVGTVFGVMAITALGEGVMAVMFVVWIRDVLGGGAPELGWLNAAQAAGGLVGGLVGAWFGRKLSPERLYASLLVVFGVIDLAIFNYPLVLDGVLIGIALMVLVGIPAVVLQAARTTILQTHVTDAFRGRVFGALATTAALLMVAGTALAGTVGDRLGPILLLNVQGGAYVAAGLFVYVALGTRSRAGEPAADPA